MDCGTNGGTFKYMFHISEKWLLDLHFVTTDLGHKATCLSISALRIYKLFAVSSATQVIQSYTFPNSVSSARLKVSERR